MVDVPEVDGESVVVVVVLEPEPDVPLPSVEPELPLVESVPPLVDPDVPSLDPELPLVPLLPVVRTDVVWSSEPLVVDEPPSEGESCEPPPLVSPDPLRPSPPEPERCSPDVDCVRDPSPEPECRVGAKTNARWELPCCEPELPWPRCA